MFGINQNQLIKNLNRIQKTLCSYFGNSCDCKFIKDNADKICCRSDEGSGCPEIRQVISLLSSLTEEEFSELCEKSNILKV